jgi:hypothetical protein
MMYARNSEAGSVLVEALFAFAVLSAVLVMSLGGFSQGAARMRQVEERLVMLASARALIAELSTKEVLTPGRMFGTTDEGFTWTADILEVERAAPRSVLRPFRVVLQIARSNGTNAPLWFETYLIGQAGPNEAR